MGSKTRKMRQQEESIKRLIVKAHRAGVCDSEGRSIDGPNGVFIPKPMSIGVCRRFRYDKNLRQMVEI